MAVEFLAVDLLASHGVSLLAGFLLQFEGGVHLGDDGVDVLGLAVVGHLLYVQFGHPVDHVVSLWQLGLGGLDGESLLGAGIGLLLLTVALRLLIALHEFVHHLVFNSLLEV